jgi:uncharacterized protein GlcG (DUF336 family)
MPDLKLRAAQKIMSEALKAARVKELKPLAVAVMDERGSLRALAAEDGASLRRAEVAMAKAYGSLAMGLGSRALYNRAAEQPSFIAAVTHAAGGMLVPAPGGVSSLSDRSRWRESRRQGSSPRRAEARRTDHV